MVDLHVAVRNNTHRSHVYYYLVSSNGNILKNHHLASTGLRDTGSTGPQHSVSKYSGFGKSSEGRFLIPTGM